MHVWFYRMNAIVLKDECMVFLSKCIVLQNKWYGISWISVMVLLSKCMVLKDECMVFLNKCMVSLKWMWWFLLNECNQNTKKPRNQKTSLSTIITLNQQWQIPHSIRPLLSKLECSVNSNLTKSTIIMNWL